MILWRISRYEDLKGIGGHRASARWHRAGHPVVYLAETPASALLEACVHTSANDVPPSYTLLRVEGPDALEISSVAYADLPEDWIDRIEVTQEIGTAWLHRRESVLLRIPSAIVPQTFNLLFNPVHDQASAFSITASFTYPFDGRLKQ